MLYAPFGSFVWGALLFLTLPMTRYVSYVYYVRSTQSEDASALRTAASMSEEEHYMTMLVQTEVERMKFVVRSYIRTRLFKVRPSLPSCSPSFHLLSYPM